MNGIELLRVLECKQVQYCTVLKRIDESNQYVLVVGSIQMYQILCHFVLSLFLLSRLVKTEKKKERGQKG